MDKKTDSGFWCTYFDKNVVMRISSWAKIFAWIITSFYFFQWLLQIGTFILQYTRGYWTGMGFTDFSQNFLWLLEQPLRGLVYFAVLQGVAQVLLMMIDIEENTRRVVKE